MRHDTLPKLVSADDLAEILGVNADTIRDWVRSGHLPSVNIGSGKQRPRLRFNVEEVQLWIAARTSRTPAAVMQYPQYV